MRQIRNFEEAHAVLRKYVPPSTQHNAYTLDRIQALMNALGNPQDSYRVVHVAGTSGKTSTCYYMASLLKESGKKVGLTVSPHVDEINERVQINLRPLSEQKFCRQLSKFIDIVSATAIKPTYFELMIAFAYWQFDQDKVDYAVIEVGLGGLLDGSNVVNRADKICVITDLGLDHTEVLGKTVEEIASQKAGIIRPSNKVIMYQQANNVMNVVREVCDQQQAELHEVNPRKSSELPTNLPLFQQRNWYLAYRVYTFLVQEAALTELSETRLANTTRTYIPARMEIVHIGNKTVIIDGAHNSQKIGTLAKSIAAQFPQQPVGVLLSVVQSKGIRTRGAVAAIAKFANFIIITSFTGQQDMPKVSVNPLKVAEYCHTIGYDKWEVVHDPAQAFRALLKRPEPVLLVTGSFYLLNHIRPLIPKK